MPIATAPALLIGLGARILLDFISRTQEPSVKDFILMGVWQGVAVHYALKNSEFGIQIACAVAVKLLIEFNLFPDVSRCATTVLGVVLGVVVNDLLSQYFDKPSDQERRRKKRTHASTHSRSERKREKERGRTVQFRPSVQGGSVETPLYRPAIISDITSVDSNSEFLGPKSSMTPLEREIITLRTRAALADSERRRYKEERKWAISQDNVARATQMKEQVKRYTALMQSFNREADLKMQEAKASGSRPRINEQLPTPAASTLSVIKDRGVKSRESGNSDNKPSSSRRASTSRHVSRDPAR